MADRLRLESFNVGHLPAILAIEKRTNAAPWSERAFRNELGNPNGIFLVALLGNRLVGYGGVWLVIDEAHVTTVSVSPEHRRQGIAARLVIELLAMARARGALCSTLEVRAGNEAAIALYERFGFKTVARRKAYYPDNKEDALVMWLHEMDALEKAG
ncbi:MAG: ribosomal protein S18-alanine N-acetyltransferase [Fimbriimonas ginsengisoli]|uniref:Ribosomal protein S18-alanine N-acetyltransferase n=1 Tax=Fimbriimonas ginsengisoli TaxID=1005039 RepID=A0A931PU94_FIMGI|nr:ribosomal protein S18-alanine N-acetyltransferase [Fimbriimonas ginsengisoli]MBI3722242.1 ribosomal protein S18-alanine N-acetyltransferase [Fimbriimonas ginsengisoli]